MKPVSIAISLIVVATAASVAGYWWGTSRTMLAGAERQEQAKTQPARKILYYRNPMGLPDTSPVPKKDSMGMDYTPVYEGEEPASDGSAVKISVEKVQRLGVRTEAAATREIVRTVRAVSTVQADERRLNTVAPKFEGWIDRLHVNTTGQAVRKGDALMDVYSPELITAQQEYMIARQGVQAVADGSPEVRAGMQRLVDSALQRLRNWDISESELQQLQKEGKARQKITLRSAVSGVVLEKPSIQGKRFMSGEVLPDCRPVERGVAACSSRNRDAAHGQSARSGRAYRTSVQRQSFIYPTVTRKHAAKVRTSSPRQALLKRACTRRWIRRRATQGKVLAAGFCVPIRPGRWCVAWRGAL